MRANHHRNSIKRRWQARLAVALCLAFVVGPAARLRAQEARRITPLKLNVLFIVADDMNATLGAYGHPIVKTPNLDRLAGRGVRFERAYTQLPWCNPSRASLLSGLRPESTRVLDNDTPQRAYLKDHVFLPQLFRAHGYFTGRAGKLYHEAKSFNGHDSEQWDASEGGAARVSVKDFVVAREHIITRGSWVGLEWNQLDVKDEDTSDGVIARRIAELMGQATANGQPFFLAAGFRKPHLPWDAPKKYFDLYDAAKITLPVEPPGGHINAVPTASLGDHMQKPPITAENWRKALRAYYAAISFMDAQVGVLLDQMDRLRLWENTVVVFLGDHGYQLGEHAGMWEKVRLWEEALRAPLIIAAPPKFARSAGQASPRIVELLDLYPTLAEVCGLPAPPNLEGRSLAPLLKHPRAKWDHAAFSVLGNKGQVRARSIRTERWRYAEWSEGERGAVLYDERADPREYRNLAADAKHAKVVSEMKRLLSDQAAKYEQRRSTPQTQK